jgi:uncharacterized protein (TIGR03435 family)
MRITVIAVLIASVVLTGQSELRPRAQSAGTASTSSPQLTFDSVSVKRSNDTDRRGALQFQPGGRLLATNIPLRPVFSMAFNLALSQGQGAIIGAPNWFDSERYNIEARAVGDPPREQMILMLQALLADRFKLVVHHETRQQLPIYALELARPGKLGAQLKPHSDGKCIDTLQPDPAPGNPLPPYCGDFRVGGAANGGLRETANAITMDRFAASLAQQVDRPIVDRTKLSGTFDVDFEFVSQNMSQKALVRDPTGSDATTSGPPLIFTAVQEQLGLKLVPTTGPVDVIVIDHVEQPSEN